MKEPTNNKSSKAMLTPRRPKSRKYKEESCRYKSRDSIKHEE